MIRIWILLATKIFWTKRRKSTKIGSGWSIFRKKLLHSPLTWCRRSPWASSWSRCSRTRWWSTPSRTDWSGRWRPCLLNRRAKLETESFSFKCSDGFGYWNYLNRLQIFFAIVTNTTLLICKNPESYRIVCLLCKDGFGRSLQACLLCKIYKCLGLAKI